LSLYGVDMDETVTPLESNLAWTVNFKNPLRDFIGRKSLEEQLKAGVKKQLVGILLSSPGVLRNHLKVFFGECEGEISSGSFSPTLGKGMALARVPQSATKTCEVLVRGKRLAANVVSLPFVKNKFIRRIE
jgi:aminomethyltransferase